MPFVSVTPRKHVEMQQDALEKLELKIKSLFKEPDDEYIFKIVDCHTDDGPAMIAVARIGDIHALYAPEYLTEKQLDVFWHFLKDADSNDHILVFSQRDYDVAKKCLHGKEVDVKLLI